MNSVEYVLLKACVKNLGKYILEVKLLELGKHGNLILHLHKDFFFLIHQEILFHPWCELIFLVNQQKCIVF